MKVNFKNWENHRSRTAPCPPRFNFPDIKKKIKTKHRKQKQQKKNKSDIITSKKIIQINKYSIKNSGKFKQKLMNNHLLKKQILFSAPAL